MLVVREHTLLAQKHSRVIPGDGLHRGLIERMVAHDVRATAVGACKLVVVFNVNSFYAAEASKFALESVVVTVVVAVGSGERGIAPLVTNTDRLNAMHRKRQPRHPWISSQPVRDIEPGRRCILNQGFRP